MLRILDAEKYKGMTRMAFIAGRRCLEDSRMLRNNAVCVSQILKVPVEEAGKAVAVLVEKTAKLEERLAIFEEDLAKKDAEELLTRDHFTLQGEYGSVKNPEFYAVSFPGKRTEELLRIGKQLQKMTEAVITMGSEKDLKFTAVCSARGADIRGLFKTFVETAGGKGGGGPAFFQGQFDTIEQYRSFFAALKKIQGST
jgi:alanyl-tRNA synthetase